MSHKKITKAFILGAGLGTRMRPLTNEMPKPMVEVGGESLIQRALKMLAEGGVRDTTINTHYKAETLRMHLKGWRSPAIRWSHEDALLDTGGGIKKALADFAGEDFFVIAGDSFWTDGPSISALRRLEDYWDPSRMDILILLEPVSRMALTKGVGDYDFPVPGAFGPVRRSRERKGTHMFTSLRINSPRIFDGAPEEAFSYLDLLDRAEASGRLYGLEHDGAWHHISTPEDLRAVDAAVRV